MDKQSEYYVDGTFLIRTDTLENWLREGASGTGALRILKKGEIGWVYKTSDFKIGDGYSFFRDLPWIKPTPESSPYALRLGTKEASYSYEEITEIFRTIEENIDGKYNTLNGRILDLDLKVDLETQERKANDPQYFETYHEFPAVGKEGPIYIDKTNGEIYIWMDRKSPNEQFGYKRLTNSFDYIQGVLGDK